MTVLSQCFHGNNQALALAWEPSCLLRGAQLSPLMAYYLLVLKLSFQKNVICLYFLSLAEAAQ